MTLTVATPKQSVPIADAVEAVPDAIGFEHVALPRYDSARSFLNVRRALDERLTDLARRHDVVQLDDGGYPVALGLLGASAARAAAKPTLWVITGDAPPDSRLARSATSAAKRAIAAVGVDRRVRRTLADAARDAAAVVASTHGLADRLRERWGVRATVIECAGIDDGDVASDAQMSARHAKLINADRPLRFGVVGPQSVDGGAPHVLAAVLRCRRLNVAVELLLDPRGPEADAVRRRADDLGLADSIRWTEEVAAFDDADVVVDAALSRSEGADLARATARGQVPIAYGRPGEHGPHVHVAARGDVDALTAAVFAAAVDRAGLAARALRGVAWSRARTRQAAHRRRFEVAADAARAKPQAA